MKFLKFLIIFLLILGTGIIMAYSEYGAPSEFGNETTTTCYIGGDNGVVNCTGNATFPNYQNTTGSIEWIGPEHIFDVDDADIEGDLNTYVDIAGDTMEGNINMNGNNISNVSYVNGVNISNLSNMYTYYSDEDWINKVGGNNFTFNDSNLLGDFWFFTEEDLVSGTSAGTISETQQYDDYDGISYNLTEEVPNGLEYYANTSNDVTTDVNKICIRYIATGDDFDVSIWDISLNDWEGYMALTPNTDFAWKCVDIRDSADHLVDDKIMIKIVDAYQASVQHKLYIDAMYVSSGYTPRIGNEVDPIFGSWLLNPIFTHNINATNVNFTTTETINSTYANIDNITVDHIAEKTAGHRIVFDNNVLLGSNSLISSGAINADTFRASTSITLGSTTLDTTEFSFLNGMNQFVNTASNPTFANLEITTALDVGSINNDGSLVTFTDNIDALTIYANSIQSHGGAEADLVVSSVDDMTISSGDALTITAGSGAISFDNEHIKTTGWVNASNFNGTYHGDGSHLTGISGSSYNATYDAKADYQFTNNNFNGSGNFNTTGTITTTAADDAIDLSGAAGGAGVHNALTLSSKTFGISGSGSYKGGFLKVDGNEFFHLVGASTSNTVFGSSVDSDTWRRFRILTDGVQLWGSGSATPDLRMERADASRMKISDGGSGGDLTVRGRVSIGKYQAPTVALDVVGAAKIDGGLNVTGSVIITGNVTFNQLVKLEAITLPSCSKVTNGSIARNSTKLYFCDGSIWNGLY